jgi:hypothetical protein
MGKKEVRVPGGKERKVIKDVHRNGFNPPADHAHAQDGRTLDRK